MNSAAIIKNSVTMQNIADHYGFKVKGGFTSCPFHSGDNTPSLKIYPDNRGWWCFGCGAHGDVIDFVRQFFGLNFQDACRKIDLDFGLGVIVTHSPTVRDKLMFQKRYSALAAKLQAEKKHRLQAKAEYDYWLNKWICADLIIQHLKPKKPEDKIADIYSEAYTRRSIAGYMLDCLEEV